MDPVVLTTCPVRSVKIVYSTAGNRMNKCLLSIHSYEAEQKSMGKSGEYSIGIGFLQEIQVLSNMYISKLPPLPQPLEFCLLHKRIIRGSYVYAVNLLLRN